MISDDPDDFDPQGEFEPEDYTITPEELAAAYIRHAGMVPIIKPLFARAVIGDGFRGDVLIGHDDTEDTGEQPETFPHPDVFG